MKKLHIPEVTFGITSITFSCIYSCSLFIAREMLAAGKTCKINTWSKHNGLEKLRYDMRKTITNSYF